MITLKRLLLLLALIVPGMAEAAPAQPQVRLEVSSRIAAFDGRTFGEAGSYERIEGVAHMRIDPRAAANRGIVDLAEAPRAADGMVDYDVDVVILRPSDPAKARRVMLYDTVNRGMKLISMLTGGPAMSQADPFDPGDGALLRHGYTFVWSGWQGDVGPMAEAMFAALAPGSLPPGFKPPKLMGARFPVVHGKTGPVAEDMIFDNLTSNRIPLTYAVASLDQANARLTVREHSDDAPRIIPAAHWRFIDERHVEIDRPADFDAGAIYNFQYTARDPWVMGLGFASVRDLISWLRHAPAAQGNPLADMAGTNPNGSFDSAVAIGLSQSARYLRDFLWQGFNADLAGHKVFDGMMPVVAGGRQTFTNFRFAEPGRFSRQHEDHDVPGFTFPFTYATLTDPISGHTDGILARCSANGTCPKLFHVDTSGEFWQAGASLVGTGGTDHDVAFPETVRAYMIAGGSHAPGLPSTKARYPINPFNYSPVMRALLPAMVDWTLARAEPPPSRWPSLARGELVTIDRVNGPTSIEWPKVINQPVPLPGKPHWPIFVPAVDADGNDRAGIHMPQLAAPTGTYLGWNLRKAGFAEGDLCFPEGSLIPFAKDAASRGDDPRPSLAERYPTHEDYLQRFKAAADDLVAARLLLPEDAASLVTQASK